MKKWVGCKMKNDKLLPIGFFDSGIGGISVLKEARKYLPNESFLYYGDNANAPYGTKSIDMIRQLTKKAAFLLVQKGIKILVIACNTATSASINDLRNELTIPVIGMEPALKPAIHYRDHGKIIVMATPATLQQEKFKYLMNRYGELNNVIPLPCPGLVEIIEKGITNGNQIDQYLEDIMKPWKADTDVVVLGCTHYVFIKESICSFFQNKIKVVDGNHGTVMQLMRILNNSDLNYDGDLAVSLNKENATVEIYTSGNSEEIIPLCYNLIFNL